MPCCLSCPGFNLKPTFVVRAALLEAVGMHVLGGPRLMCLLRQAKYFKMVALELLKEVLDHIAEYR